MRSTRTWSAYFSPNRAMAPDALASSRDMIRVSTMWLSRICRLTRRSIARSCSRVTGSKWEKSKRRALRIHQRALLLHMIAQHLAQGGVHQVGGGMVERRGLAPLRVHPGIHPVADLRALPSTTRPRWPNDVAALLAGYPRPRTRRPSARQPPGVAHLAAGLGVERGAVQHHHALLARPPGCRSGSPSRYRATIRRLVGQALVAGEVGLALERPARPLVGAELAGGPGALPLRSISALEALHVEASGPAPGRCRPSGRSENRRCRRA